MMRHPIHKKSYLLLEVLCCLALISMILFPLLKPNIALCQKKHKDLVAYEQAQLNNKAFNEVKRQLYLNEVSFEALKKGTRFSFKVEETLCQADVHLVKRTNKPSLNRIGLLLQVDLSVGKQINCVSKLVFVEGMIG